MTPSSVMNSETMSFLMTISLVPRYRSCWRRSSGGRIDTRSRRRCDLLQIAKIVRPGLTRTVNSVLCQHRHMPKPRTIDEYLAGVSAEQRAALVKLRNAVHAIL